MLAMRVPDGLSPGKRKAWLEFIASRTSFGDGTPRDPRDDGGLGPGALRNFGLDGDLGDSTLHSFPVAFRQGMGSRRAQPHP